jgi:hypothetical protein
LWQALLLPAPGGVSHITVQRERAGIAAEKSSERGEAMSETITQTRLSLRLDMYLSEYEGKHVRTDNLSRQEWETVWEAANVARTQHTLTPELVDDVRKALQKL